jgi:PAS domain S-box-containing protein
MKTLVRRGASAPRHARVNQRARANLIEELGRHQVELESQNTQLVEAQFALELSRARYAELYDQAPVGYCTLNESGAIVEINLRGAAILGQPRERLLGQLLRMFFPTRSRADFDEHLRACLRRGVSNVSELELGVGPVAAVEVASTPIEASLGEGGGCLTMLSDITRRRAAEEERARLLLEATAARAAAEVANRTKDDFLAIVSHELRSPVATMLMWIHLMRNNGSDAAFRAQALEAIELSSKAQIKLLDDLLDLARCRTGKLRLDRRRLPLARIIEQAVLAATPLAADKGVTLASSVAGTLGVVDGDEIRLGQVLGNILANAIKFSTAPGQVQLRAAAGGGMATIQVHDRGSGIPAKVLPHIFELFHQDEGMLDAHRKGIGVGLAIVKQLVEAHGGSVEAASEGKGKGATLTVRLPLVAVEESPAAQAVAAAPPPPRDLADTLAGVDVLVVEDDDQMRMVMGHVLRIHGAEVASAASLAEGRELLRRSQPRVLVSDLNLSDGDGYTLVRELREREGPLGRRTPALAITSMAATREQALAAGFDRHLTKPVEADALIACIAQLVAAA